MNGVRNWYERVTYEETVRIIEANIRTGENAVNSMKESCVEARRAYVAVGWYLRNAQDKELFLEGGYRNIWEFAKDKFGYSRDETSRLIGINRAFSKDGNTPILDDRYQEFGKSQLQEMLSLPDEKREEVTPDMTVRQIRALKKPEPKEVYTDAEKREIMLQAFECPALKALIPALNQRIYELHENNCDAVREIVVPALPVSQGELTVEYAGGIRITVGDRFAVWPYFPFMEMYMDLGFYQIPEPAKCITGKSEQCGAAANCDEPVQCCAACDNDCNSRCGWLDGDAEEECATSHKNDAEEVPDEPDDDELLCDDCANASCLTGNVDLCANCGPDGRYYKALPTKPEQPEAVSGEVEDTDPEEQSEPAYEEPQFTVPFLRYILWDNEQKLRQLWLDEELFEECNATPNERLPERMMREQRAIVAGLRLLLEQAEMRDKSEGDQDDEM